MVNDFSILAVIYFGDEKKYVEKFLTSLRNQTHQNFEIVLVINGKISFKIHDMLRDLKLSHKTKILQLNENLGLSNALNFGFHFCKGKFIARMDPDDECHPERLKESLKALNENKAEIVFSWHDEIDNASNQNGFSKKAPENNEQIIAALKLRNVISHPSVVFSKSTFRQLGGYNTDTYLFEDWDLWLRASKEGLSFYCIQRSLVFVRVNQAQFNRRVGLKYLFKQFRVFQKWRSERILTRFEFVKLAFLHSIKSLLPVFIFKYAYKLVRTKS